MGVVYLWSHLLLLSGHSGKSEKWEVGTGKQIHHRELCCSWEARWWETVYLSTFSHWFCFGLLNRFNLIFAKWWWRWWWRWWWCHGFLSRSPLGGRYKKEVLVDGQTHLLLIREEAGSPDVQVLACVCGCVHVSADFFIFLYLLLLLLQFSSWVDAVMLVFSLENESSFQELYQLYSQLSVSRSDIPVIVVGTQGQPVNHCHTKHSGRSCQNTAAL